MDPFQALLGFLIANQAMTPPTPQQPTAFGALPRKPGTLGVVNAQPVGYGAVPQRTLEVENAATFMGVRG